MPTIYGPSADIDAGQAYLFQCDDNGLFAISRDRSGRNLPPGPCAEGWQFLMEFALGIQRVARRRVSSARLFPMMNTTVFALSSNSGNRPSAGHCMPDRETVKVRQGTGPRAMVTVLLISLLACAAAGVAQLAYFFFC